MTLTWRRLLVGAILATSPLLVGAQSAPTVRQLYGQTIRDLAACQTRLGTLTSFYADVVDGTYQDWPSIQREIEAVNPTLTIDIHTHRVSQKGPK